MDELIDALVGIAILIIPVLGGILVFHLRGYLAALEEKAKAELGDKQYNLLLSLATSAVEAAEQTITHGEPKKLYATNMLKGLCEKYSIPISDEQIDMLIEAAVRSDIGWSTVLRSKETTSPPQLNLDYETAD